jgi:hypothetical protein
MILSWELCFTFVGDIAETVPNKFPPGDRATKSHFSFINSYDQPVTPAGAVLNMYFLSWRKGIRPEKNHLLYHDSNTPSL